MMKCKKHPKYKAIRKPKDCPACWWVYFANNDAAYLKMRGDLLHDR